MYTVDQSPLNFILMTQKVYHGINVVFEFVVLFTKLLLSLNSVDK